jgi:hypothetical protein
MTSNVIATDAKQETGSKTSAKQQRQYQSENFNLKLFFSSELVEELSFKRFAILSTSPFL